MAETYHGVEIPDDLWQSWNDPNSSEVSGWRRGVLAALHGTLTAADDLSERQRLQALAEIRDKAEQSAFEDKHRNEPWMQRRIAFREMMKEK